MWLKFETVPKPQLCIKPTDFLVIGTALRNLLIPQTFFVAVKYSKFLALLTRYGRLPVVKFSEAQT